VKALRRLLRRAPRLFVLLYSPDDRELGELGEEVAASHLARRGWRILARRWRTRRGEADLVARRGDALAVVEVKTGRWTALPRPRGAELPEGALFRWRPGFRCDAARIARLRAVGRELAGRRPARVDLVEVWLSASGRSFRILHHEDLRAPLDPGST